jgi:hypothetical protein
MTEQTRSDLISRIIDLEYEITSAIINGHKPSVDDIFQEKRNELNTLRKNEKINIFYFTIEKTLFINIL